MKRARQNSADAWGGGWRIIFRNNGLMNYFLKKHENAQEIFIIL
jgi:hypothetical protein